MTDSNWVKIWNLVKGRSPVGQAIRAAIYYVVGLGILYLITLANYAVGALLTVILLLASVKDMYENSEAGLRTLVKRAPSSVATLIVAYALHQTLDYLFAVLFLVFLFWKLAERYNIL